MRARPATLAVGLVALSLALPAAALVVPAPAPGALPAGPLPGAVLRAEVAHAAHLLGIVPVVPEPGPCPGYEASVRAHFAHLGLRAPGTIPSLGDAALEREVGCTLQALRAADAARDALLQAAGLDLTDFARATLRDDLGYLEALPPMDLAPVLGAGMALADRLDQALLALRASPMPAQARATLDLPEVDLSPVLAIDRTGNTLYDCDYALVLDRVGDDLYDNNAGGTWLAMGEMPIFFLSGEPNRCSQTIAPLGPEQPSVQVGGEFEFGLLVTAAALVDDQGNDTYGVRKVPLLDSVCTTEHINRRIGAQGAGVIGTGVLIDTSGDNTLVAKTLSQGMGHGTGLGLMYLGPGDDTLEAIRSAQGSGVFNAVGILVNEGGDDTYVGRAPAGGTANIDLGICDDTSRYMQGAGFGRITGVATGWLGLLRDLGGNDRYESEFKVQGAGEINAHGILIEEGGDDVYVARAKAMGYGEGHTSTGGTGTGYLLERGGNDLYLLESAPGLGMGDGRVSDPSGIPGPYIPPNVWASEAVGYMLNPLLLTGGALLRDERGGLDSYSLASRGNDMTVVADSMVGVFIDE